MHPGASEQPVHPTQGSQRRPHLLGGTGIAIEKFLCENTLQFWFLLAALRLVSKSSAESIMVAGNVQ